MAGSWPVSATSLCFLSAWHTTVSLLIARYMEHLLDIAIMYLLLGSYQALKITFACRACVMCQSVAHGLMSKLSLIMPPRKYCYRLSAASIARTLIPCFSSIINISWVTIIAFIILRIDLCPQHQPFRRSCVMWGFHWALAGIDIAEARPSFTGILCRRARPISRGYWYLIAAVTTNASRPMMPWGIDGILSN